MAYTHSMRDRKDRNGADLEGAFAFDVLPSRVREGSTVTDYERDMSAYAADLRMCTAKVRHALDMLERVEGDDGARLAREQGFRTTESAIAFWKDNAASWGTEYVNVRDERDAYSAREISYALTRLVVAR